MKRILALLLVALFVLSVPAAYARWSYTFECEASLGISGGTATYRGMIRPSDSSNHSTITVTLKRKVGSSWETYAGPYSASGTTGSGASVSKTKTLESGYYYKTVVTGKILDPDTGKTLETVNSESSQKAY